jgi:subtilase family serine protease
MYVNATNMVYVMLKRVTKDIQSREFNMTLYAAKGKTDEWFEVANKSVRMDGFLADNELHAYLLINWTPEETGEFRLKANVTTDITDINETNNEFAVSVNVIESSFELGMWRAEVTPPSTEKLSPPFCTMAAYILGKDPHLEGEMYYASPTRGEFYEPSWFGYRMRDWVLECFEYGTTLSLRNAGEWSTWTLGIVAAGENPNNFGSMNYDGMFKKFYDGEKIGSEVVEDVAWEDAFTLMALVSTGETEYEREMVVTLTRDLLSRQNEDGSWKFTYESNGKSSDTAIAIQALCAVKADLSSSSLWRDQNKAVNNGLAYLKTMQNADGSFPFLKNDSSMLATAHAVQAFIAADRAPLNGSVAYLKQQQSVYEEYLFVALNSGAYNEELNNETVPANLREVFRRYEHGEYELSPNVTVTVTEVNECWTLLDEDNNNEYILRADGEYILVYQKKEDLNAMEQAARITAMYGQPYPAAIQTLRVRTLPDLEPTRMDTPVSAIVYTNCTVSSIVRNNGGAFNVSLLVDGKPAVTKRVYSVWSQGGTEVLFTWRPAKAGRHKLTVYCDYSDEIGECDETNNAISDFVDVRKPDLKPETLRAKTNMVSMNNTVEVTIKGTTDETYNVAFYEDDELRDKQRVNVTVGETGLNFSWMPTEKGLHNLSIDVDCDDEVEESNEGNNVKTVRVWAGLPDLYIKKHEVPALYANATNPILVDIGGIASAFNVSLLVNGTCVDTRRLTAESTEEALNTTLHWTPNRTGKYELYVAVDSGNEVPERDETNNNVTISKEVVLPDLIPVAIDTSPHLFYNESNQLTVNITGAGDEFNVSLLVSGGICSGTNCTINETEIVGKKVVSFYENISVVFAWTPDRLGVCNLTVLVDPDNDLYEANEMNNNRTQTVQVYERIPVELRAPKGGETWEGVREINWHATVEKPVRIDLKYSPDRGRRWVNIVHNTENDGVFEWDTRNVMDGYDYSIKVEAYAEDAYGEAMSNLFTISNTKTEESWGSFHENAGFSMSTTPNKPKLLWASPAIQAVPSSSLIVMNGKIYVFCSDGSNGWLTCLDEDSGQAVSSWGSNGKSTKGEYGESSWATPAYYNGKIYLPMKGTIYVSSKSADDYFTASLGTVALHEIDAASGTAAVYHYLGGARETVNAVNGGALAAYGTVFFSTYNNHTYYKVGSEHKFTEEDVLARFEDHGNNIWVSPVTYGGWDWSYRVDYDALSTPGAGNGNIYFGEGNMGFAAGALYCVDQNTGTRKWKEPFAAGVFCSPTVIGGNVYITTFGAVNKISGVYALDAVDGDRKWATEWPTGTRASDSTPAYAPLDNGYVYVAGGGGREMDDTFVVCLDAKNGRKKWDVHSKTDEKGIEHNIGYWTNSPAVSIDKKVFVGEPTSSGGWSQFDYHGLWCLNATTGDDLWHTEYGGSTVAITNGRIYTSGAGKVFAYGPENLPDLVVGDITPEIGGDKVDGGVPVAIDVVVKNIGATDVNGTFKVALRYNEEEIGTETADSLTMGNETVHEFWWTPPEVSQPTNYTLQAEVNPDKSVNEADLTNNRNTTEVTVCPMRPDIELVALNAPSQAEPGERCNITVDVRNNGARATNISVHLYVDGERITGWTIAALGQSEMWTNETTWVTPQSPGDYTLKAVADKDGSIDEYNEKNNEKEVNVSVKWELQTPIPPGEGPGEGPGYGGGGGGGSGGGIGLGIGPERGTGESGSEEHSGMKNPIKSSHVKETQKKQVSGFAFGNSSAGKSGGGGGGSLYLYLLLLFLLVMTFFYMGYYKEKKAHRREKHKK